MQAQKRDKQLIYLPLIYDLLNIGLTFVQYVYKMLGTFSQT